MRIGVRKLANIGVSVYNMFNQEKVYKGTPKLHLRLRLGLGVGGTKLVGVACQVVMAKLHGVLHQLPDLVDFHLHGAARALVDHLPVRVRVRARCSSGTGQSPCRGTSGRV